MRRFLDLRVGEIWAPNDPRRWDRFVRITTGRHGNVVGVRDRDGRFRFMLASVFFKTGRDGYQRWH